MRTLNSETRFFLGGILVALAFVGVAFGTVGTVRRVRQRKLLAKPSIPPIDGVRAPEPVELALQPQEEATTGMFERLESERVEVNQRW